MPGRAGGLRRRLLPVRAAPAPHRRLRRGADQLLPVLGGLPARAGARPTCRAWCAARAPRAPGKRVVISETGWPDHGQRRSTARCPRWRARCATSSTPVEWARAATGIEVFYFAAFDEAWKVGAEGDVGAYWGLWDKDGQAKVRVMHTHRTPARRLSSSADVAWPQPALLTGHSRSHRSHP